MKIDFGTPLTDLKGEIIKEGEEVMTLASAVTASLLVVLPEDQNTSGPEKYRMFKIATKASDGGEQELSAEDVTLVKARVAKLYGALIVGRVYDILEA